MTFRQTIASAACAPGYLFGQLGRHAAAFIQIQIRSAGGRSSTGASAIELRD